MNWLASPIFFYPFVVLCGCCVVLYQLGILGVMIEVALPSIKLSINGVLSKTPVPIRI
jgi:hypothetical protein